MGAAYGCCCNTDTVAPTLQNKPPSSNHRPRREDTGMEAFTNITLSEDDPSERIRGYENEPLVSLEEALKPFDGKIDQLSHYIKEAKKNCHFPSEHNLTHDESAAIYIYTMIWGKGCLYNHLEAAWKSKDPYKLTQWFKYFKLFRTALNKLPNVKKEIWQGKAFDEKLKEQLHPHSPELYSSMSVCLQLETDVKDHLKRNGVEEIILVGYKSVNGKVVTGYTAGDWQGVIMWPGMKVGVTKVERAPDGTLFIHLTRKLEPRPKSNMTKSSSLVEHFVCPYTGCGNRCPGNHKGDHCHTFAMLSHKCSHHCGPCYKCEKCGKLVPNLCKCYNCGSSYCAQCCYK